MKKLLSILSLAFCLQTSNAQQTKPTKEQTVAFIKDWFEKNELRSKVSYGSKSEREHGFVKQDIQFNTDATIVTFNIQTYSTSVYEGRSLGYACFNDKYTIDLRKIEKIYSNYFSRLNDDMYLVGFEFIATPNYNIEVLKGSSTKNAGKNACEDIPFSSTIKEKKASILINYEYKDSEGNPSFDQKIIKAFNHLRKLNGAPEPVSFD